MDFYSRYGMMEDVVDVFDRSNCEKDNGGIQCFA